MDTNLSIIYIPGLYLPISVSVLFKRLQEELNHNQCARGATDLAQAHRRWQGPGTDSLITVSIRPPPHLCRIRFKEDRDLYFRWRLVVSTVELLWLDHSSLKLATEQTDRQAFCKKQSCLTGLKYRRMLLGRIRAVTLSTRERPVHVHSEPSTALRSPSEAFMSWNGKQLASSAHHPVRDHPQASESPKQSQCCGGRALLRNWALTWKTDQLVAPTAWPTVCSPCICAVQAMSTRPPCARPLSMAPSTVLSVPGSASH